MSYPDLSTSNATPAPSIFIADDDEEDQFILQKGFQKVAPQVELRFFKDGQALLDQIDQPTQPPALLVLDLNMPRLNGFETLRAIRQLPHWDQVPVVILTTTAAKDAHQQALSLGAAQFLTKPSGFDQLLQIIEQLMRHRRDGSAGSIPS